MDTTTIVAILLADAVICAIAGGVAASSRFAAGQGAALGFILGPIGVIAALGIDQRPVCSNCGGRMEEVCRVCQHCGASVLGKPNEDGVVACRPLPDVRSLL